MELVVLRSSGEQRRYARAFHAGKFVQRRAHRKRASDEFAQPAPARISTNNKAASIVAAQKQPSISQLRIDAILQPSSEIEARDVLEHEIQRERHIAIDIIGGAMG